MFRPMAILHKVENLASDIPFFISLKAPFATPEA